jgi:hypothetical protein
VMRYGHELGQHRSTEDGVVRGVEVRNLNVKYSVRKFSFVPKVTGKHT